MNSNLTETETGSTILTETETYDKIIQELSRLEQEKEKLIIPLREIKWKIYAVDKEIENNIYAKNRFLSQHPYFLFNQQLSKLNIGDTCKDFPKETSGIWQFCQLNEPEIVIKSIFSKHVQKIPEVETIKCHKDLPGCWDYDCRSTHYINISKIDFEYHVKYEQLPSALKDNLLNDGKQFDFVWKRKFFKEKEIGNYFQGGFRYFLEVTRTE